MGGGGAAWFIPEMKFRGTTEKISMQKHFCLKGLLE